MPRCKANTSRFRGHRVLLYPTKEQKTEFDRNIEVARAVYNIGLGIQLDNYNNGGKYIGLYDMDALFVKMKNENPKYFWLKEVPYSTVVQSLADLDNAFQRFFKKISGFPNFKSKKLAKKSYTTRHDRTHICGSKIKISGISHKNKFVEVKNHTIPDDKVLYNPTITFDGYRYWFSCCAEKEKVDMSNVPKTEPVGIDVGVRNMITTSNGEVYQFSDTSKLEKRLKRQQRRLDKDYRKYMAESMSTKIKYEDVPKSKNHLKRLAQQRKTYDKIRNKRHQDMNLATKRIVDQNPEAIVIENISVREIQKNEPWMNKYAPQMAFSEIHRQLKYKAEDRDIPVIVADRNYPSTKKCSNCGYIYDKIGSKHIFKCPNCGFVIDRDLNAAINLKSLAMNEK